MMQFLLLALKKFTPFFSVSLVDFGHIFVYWGDLSWNRCQLNFKLERSTSNYQIEAQ